MIIIVTFSCGRPCRVKADTVVVACDPQELDDVISKLSTHSCYYQGHAKAQGYEDLAVLEGRLVRCELLPESSVDEVSLLSGERFRQLWHHRDQLAREVAEELRSERARSEGRFIRGGPRTHQTPEARSRRRNREASPPCRIAPVPARQPRGVYALATFTDDGRAEMKASTVLVNVDAGDIGELVTQLSMHSCYWQSCPGEYADLVIVEGTLVRCELAPVDKETRLLTLEEFQALWKEEEQGIHEDREDMDARRRMRARASTGHE